MLGTKLPLLILILNQLWSLMMVCLGTACVAQYSVDSQFYRGEIICLDSNSDNVNVTAGVRFVDYGSFEYVSRDR